MDNKRIVKYFMGFSLVVSLGSFLAGIFYHKAFLSSGMLMLSLFLFSSCYFFKDDKKNIMYSLFILGVLLIIGALVYTYLSLRLI